MVGHRLECRTLVKSFLNETNDKKLRKDLQKIKKEVKTGSYDKLSVVDLESELVNIANTSGSSDSEEGEEEEEEEKRRRKKRKEKETQKRMQRNQRRQ